VHHNRKILAHASKMREAIRQKHLKMALTLRHALSSFVLLLLSMSFAASPASTQEHMDDKIPHWDYVGPNGPAHWADLSPAYKLCRDGKEQSPINILNPRVGMLAPLLFNYVPTQLRILDTGRYVQINSPTGGSLTIGGKSYSLVQFQFHHPSEEAIAGHSYPMTAHLVHTEARGRTAVVVVFFTVGKENPFIQVLWDHIPRHPATEEIPAGVTFDLSGLLPTSRDYYSYAGSLTIPPCTEGIRWYVLKTLVEVSAAQLTVMAKLYPNNARPVQPLNGRQVLESGGK
jgi:carbonic anhydrase